MYEPGQEPADTPRFISILAVLIGSGSVDAYSEMLPSALRGALTPAMVKEAVYQAVAYLGIGRVLPFLPATNRVLEANGTPIPLPNAATTSADALRKLLQDSPVTVAMRDYAHMEKVGPLGQSLPRNDEQITTAPGDLILYQGDALVLYYALNSWNFTRLGRIDNVTPEELKPFSAQAM